MKLDLPQRHLLDTLAAFLREGCNAGPGTSSTKLAAADRLLTTFFGQILSKISKFCQILAKSSQIFASKVAFFKIYKILQNSVKNSAVQIFVIFFKILHFTFRERKVGFELNTLRYNAGGTTVPERRKNTPAH